jgi:hypothetical protein
MHTREMKLKDINRDNAYDFSYPPRPERCAALENKIPGLPLLIVDQEKRLVWGHDYLRFLLGRGRKRSIVLETSIAPAAALFLNFNLSTLFFGLNLYEKLHFVKKISAFVSAPEIQRRAELDFTLAPALVHRLGELLDVSLRRVLACGRLGLKAALRLIDFPPADRQALLKMFLKVKFSESHQLQVMQLLEETAFREKKSFARVLAGLRLAPLLAQEMPQHRIMEALRRRRFPIFSRRESEWRQWQKNKSVPGRIALTHAPFFTTEEIQISLTAKNRPQAEELLKKIK